MAARSPACDVLARRLPSWPQCRAGRCAAMRCAISMARSTCWPAGTTSCTSPICSARCGVELVAQHQVVHRVAPAGAGEEAEVGAAQRRDAALGLHLAEARLSAATTMSPASTISMPTVKQMPCTAVTTGLRRAGASAERVDRVGRGLDGVAVGPKNFGMSRPAVKWSPAAQSTPTHSSSSRSNAVRRVGELRHHLRHEGVLLGRVVDDDPEDPAVGLGADRHRAGRRQSWFSLWRRRWRQGWRAGPPGRRAGCAMRAA